MGNPHVGHAHVLPASVIAMAPALFCVAFAITPGKPHGESVTPLQARVAPRSAGRWRESGE